MADEDNPFRLPPDDQIFAIREHERQRRAEWLKALGLALFLAREAGFSTHGIASRDDGPDALLSAPSTPGAHSIAGFSPLHSRNSEDFEFARFGQTLEHNA